MVDKEEFEAQKQTEENIFEQSFDEALKAEEKKEAEAAALLSQYTSELGMYLKSLFADAEKDRRMKELEWLKDLRQYRGEYEPEILSKIHPKRSKAFMSITKAKVKAVTSRMTDMLFPATKEKNWGIIPTPVPELSPPILEQIQGQLKQQGLENLTIDELKRMINEEAHRRCKEMEKEMDDQLAEVQYRNIIRSVIRSGNLYGTGILKGPLVMEKKVKRWIKGQNGWASIDIPKILPWVEYVSIWDIYPDMNARTPEQLQYVFQRHAMNRFELQRLANRSDFRGDAIKAYMRLYPDGDAEFKSYETELRNIASGPESVGVVKSKRYDVLEYWGYLSTDEVKKAGVELPEGYEEKYGLEVAVNVWLLGNMIIKIILAPVDGVDIPYFWYYYEKDETSIWGIGIPAIMRDTQSLLNASIRAMIDNAAIAAGPIIEANEHLLAPDEDPTDVYPFRVFRRVGRGADAASPAIKVYNLDAHTVEYMRMVELFIQLTDEITSIPRYLAGEATQIRGAAARTATGLSMLMGAANITLKDQIKNFDDGITKPFITALYHWNMDFNPKQDIKGDFSVIAKGSSSLIAKEVRLEALNQILAITSNPQDALYIKRDKLLRSLFENLDLDDLDILRDENEVRQLEQQIAQQQQEERRFRMNLELLKAKSSGHVTDEDAQQILQPQQLQPEDLKEIQGENRGLI